MAEDIIDFESHEDEAPEATAPEVPAASPREDLTKEDLTAFGTAVAQQVLAALQPAAGATTSQTLPDFENQFMNRAADTATVRLLEMNKPIFAANIAEQVAGEFGAEVKKEIVAELQKLPGHVVANITQSPDDLRKLARMARGIHAERQNAQAPRSNAAGTVGGATTAENDMATKFWNDYKDVPGFTKEMAKQMAKDRN